MVTGGMSMCSKSVFHKGIIANESRHYDIKKVKK